MEIGGYWINHINIQQRPGFADPFKTFIESVNPARILEVGTSYGGLTYFLSTITSVPILSVELEQGKPDANVYELADIYIENAFKEPFLSNTAEPFISSSGTSLVLIDAEPKTWGFDIYSKLLKPGDYIAVHDYFDSWDDFYENHQNKTWNWCEATTLELSGTAINCNLTKLDVGLKNYFWGVYKKL